MKIKELLLAQPVLQKLNTQPMPGKLAYAMAKNFRVINIELEDFEKARKKMLEMKWKIDEKTNNFDIPKEDLPEAQKMFDELLEQDIKFEPIKITAHDLERLELSPGDVMAIEWLISE